MNVEFKQEAIELSWLRHPQTVTMLVEGDVIVPDVKPDMKEILMADAGAMITGTHQTDAKLTVNGVATVKILYMPEESTLPKCMDAKFDFNEAVETATVDQLSLHATARVEHVDYTLIHSRKLHVKLVIGLSVNGYQDYRMSHLCDGDEERIKLRKRNVNAYHCVADSSRDVLVSEGLEVPAAKPDIAELIKLDVRAIKDECKVMSGKILLKGALAINCLYIGDDEEQSIERLEYEIPFSDVVDVDGLDDECLCHIHYVVKDVCHTVKDDINGDARIILLEVPLMAMIMAGKTETFSVIDDCYSTVGETSVSRERMRFDELLCEGTSYETVKDIVSAKEGMPPVGVVYATGCRPAIKELQMAGDVILVKGVLACTVLYGSSESEQRMHSLAHSFDFEHKIPVDGLDETALFECHVTDAVMSFSINAAGEIELRTNLEFYSRVVRKNEPELVTACELQEDASCKKNHGLIIYFARAEDTLWDVAKRYRVDQEKVKLLNQLSGEKLMAGQKILIPVC